MRKVKAKEQGLVKRTTAEVEVLEADFADVMGIITRRRARALMSVNVENLLTYWEVGAYLSGKIASDGWGKSTIDRLVVYIKTHDPTAKGYGRSNLYGMVAFYEAFSREDFLSLVEHYHNRLPQLPESVDAGIVQPVAGQLKRGVKAQPLVAQIVQPVAGQSFPKILFLSTFTSLQLILNHCKTAQEWLFYIIYAYRERLTKRELMSVLAHDAYTAVLGSDPKNYSKELKKKYPTVPLLIKDTAFVDYLSLPEKHREKKLRSEIVTHIKDFILEMGKDFLFVDQEYTLPVGGEDFHSDLLFYHRGLQCLVAFELKSRKFRPQDLGQLEFYLEALDRDVKKENENPSIGILLCKQANQVVVEYALSRTMSPVMVAQYKKQLIPKEVLQRTFEEYLALPETIPEDDGGR